MPSHPDLLRFHESANAPTRLAAVRATGLLDTPVERAFDRFTTLAHRLLDAPVCLLTLVDSTRDFVKSAIGLPEPLASMREVPTGPGAPSFCQYIVAEGEPLLLDDARGHPLFGEFPSVRHAGAVACAGAPLHAPDGQRLGTLCVLDFVPRTWTAATREVLLSLAEGASTEIALRLEAERAHAARREREEMLRLFVEHTPAAVAMLDGELRYLAVSRRWMDELAGGGRPGDAPPAGTLLGRRHDRTFADLPAAWHAAYARALAGEGTRGADELLERADGRVEHVRHEVQPWHAADGSVAGVMIAVELTTERHRLERALSHQATHDALTGLPNRVLFHERLGRALARRAAGRGAPVGAGDEAAVLLVDLDDLRGVNDALGHAAGDQLVQSVATRLLGATRGFDTVARLGGDEFAVLLEGLAAPGDAEVVVGRIHRALQGTAWLAPSPSAPAQGVLTSASIGVAHAGAESTPEGVLRDAGVALARAKALGRGRHVAYDAAAEEARLAHRTLEGELRRVLAHPDAADPACGRLALVFQPVVRLDDGAAVSVEALVRWHHPTRGTIAPTVFVPLAEAAGLVGSLGRWVLRAACAAMAAWEAALPGERVPTVAVNVSGRQLDEPDLVREVALALRDAGVAPERVTLEITETALADDPAVACDVLVALRALGVRLAIDDFGTGYSSLGYLQQFPVDVLKIDKRFVDGVAAGGSDGALARTIIALAESLGLRTVAEGIEHEGQREALRALGCELGQGYLFARPMSAAALPGWLAERHAAAPRPAGAGGR